MSASHSFLQNRFCVVEVSFFCNRFWFDVFMHEKKKERNTIICDYGARGSNARQRALDVCIPPNFFVLLVASCSLTSCLQNRVLLHRAIRVGLFFFIIIRYVHWSVHEHKCLSIAARIRVLVVSECVWISLAVELRCEEWSKEKREKKKKRRRRRFVAFIDRIGTADPMANTILQFTASLRLLVLLNEYIVHNEMHRASELLRWVQLYKYARWRRTKPEGQVCVCVCSGPDTQSAHEIMARSSLERRDCVGQRTDKWHVICPNVVIHVHYSLLRQHHICSRPRPRRMHRETRREVGRVDRTTFHSHRVDCFIYFVSYFRRPLSRARSLSPSTVDFDWNSMSNVWLVLMITLHVFWTSWPNSRQSQSTTTASNSTQLTHIFDWMRKLDKANWAERKQSRRIHIGSFIISRILNADQ